jgi:hypothetical protein
MFFIFLVNFLANKFYWYFSIWWFDMPMHFLGGFWIGLAFVFLFPPKDSSMTSVFKIIFFVLLIGVGWEVFEIFFNNYLAQNPFNMLDTISDVFFDLSGGLCAILYLWRKQQKKQLE